MKTNSDFRFPHSAADYRRRALIDVVVAMALGTLVFLTAAKQDLLEQFVVFSRRHEDWNVDELAILGIFGLFAALVLVARRARDLQLIDKTLQESNRKLIAALTEVDALRKLVPTCAWCGNVKDQSGSWRNTAAYLEDSFGTTFTHGICPECRTKVACDLEDG